MAGGNTATLPHGARLWHGRAMASHWNKVAWALTGATLALALPAAARPHNAAPAGTIGADFLAGTAADPKRAGHSAAAPAKPRPGGKAIPTPPAARTDDSSDPIGRIIARLGTAR